MPALRWGEVPVPFTSAWTAEETFRVDVCPYARVPAICQEVRPGEGKPRFGTPHSQRQRQAVILGLCDLCARPLKNTTRVSLSHARPRNGAEGMCVMQVEPLAHRACAAESIRHCPSLKRDIRAGTLMVRQVIKARPQLAIIAPEYLAEYVPGYQAKPTDRIVGHAKVELQRWVDRDEAWLR
jgi:hypothetical protein